MSDPPPGSIPEFSPKGSGPAVAEDIGAIVITSGQSERGLAVATISLLLAIFLWGANPGIFAPLVLLVLLGLFASRATLKSTMTVRSNAISIDHLRFGVQRRITVPMTAIEKIDVVSGMFRSKIRVTSRDGTTTDVILGRKGDHWAIAGWLSTRLTQIKPEITEDVVPPELENLWAARALLERRSLE